MTAGVTTRAAVPYSVPTEFIAAVRLKTQVGSVMRNLIFHDELPEGEGPIYELTELARVTAYALTEGVDMAQAQQITDAHLEVTPAEYGAQVFLSDLAKNQITRRTNLMRMAGQILGQAFVTKEDCDLISLMDGFSVALGGAATALVPGYIMAAGAAIKGGGQAASTAITAGTQEPGPDPIQGVFTSAQMHAVRKAIALGTLTTAGVAQPRSDLADAVLKGASVGKIGDVNVYLDDNIGKDSSDDAKGGVFSKQALVHIGFAGGPKMEPERDASMRGTELNIVGIYGTGEWKDAWGREMLFDAAAPTS
jgi:hypothetical protein